MRCSRREAQRRPGNRLERGDGVAGRGGVGGVGDDEDLRAQAAPDIAAEMRRDLDGEDRLAGKDGAVDLGIAGNRRDDVEIAGLLHGREDGPRLRARVRANTTVGRCRGLASMA